MSNPLDQRNVVYALRLRGSSEIRYVGITTRRLKERLWQHRASARRGVNLPVADWMRKHGPENIEASILEASLSSIDALASREIYWIAEMSRQRTLLLNVAKGGKGVAGVPCSPENRKATGDRFRGKIVPRDRIERMLETRKASGYRHSPESIERIRAARRASGYVPPKGESHWNYGKRRSAETRTKLRNAALGRKYSPERLAAHLKTRPRGSNVNTSRFTDAEVELIVMRLWAGEGVTVIADEMSVARQTISRIKSGETWSHIDRVALRERYEAALNAGQSAA